ncbi:hypothetical protein PN465_19910 [Nodularia spumigena CS-584]|jgi:hypothetical protein|uniref:Tetrapyrrole methylase domain-containing protein n=1 Tax=Nodularia spumigena UHCC 0060 TaxID=3110300 RepID=A0ABU5UXJ0_NODSP|nr:hypothetical protein [Nodularia spumigena]AHJ30034.1 hypothetical protein NSP_37310 [Nodularia spumigena CCY9414]EAW46354.1 hypothetical protein N9414_11619 [Nodularia spumigena CCY9414]MDB9348173.1 hypothetical protein [Nodularia spumigena CS-588/01]MDB9351280.1 hypothetical protein [Nodularia spumigena CS-588/05]MDB9384461.1 hypothetical protein [Nodularia spumigena CS-584]
MPERNIGIIGDGATDRAIFRKISECILSNGYENNVTLNYFELKRQTLHDPVEKYCREVGKLNSGCYLTGKQAADFRNAVTHTLYGAFAEFEKEVTEVSNRDIILLTADSEHTLTTPDEYFKDWRFSISKILVGGIETFYGVKAIQGYKHEDLPLVIPLVTFPSTEIFIAAAKDLIGKKPWKNPGELKQLLYGTKNLQTLREEDLQSKALDFITMESIGRIFYHVPESRTFIQTLSLGKYS